MTASSPVTIDASETAVIARLDDGGPNAVGHAVVDGLSAAADRAEEANLPLVIIGREGMFSAGFDLKVLDEGADKFAQLVERGAGLLRRLVAVPVPVVIGAGGHAVAMGSLLLLAADYRVGAEGRFKIGLNEVSIGMALPNFAVQLTHHRLSSRHALRATTMAEMYRPEAAADAGYLDEVVSAGELESTVLAKAEALSKLSRGAFAVTKGLVRADLVAGLDSAVEADRAAISGG